VRPPVVDAGTRFYGLHNRRWFM